MGMLTALHSLEVRLPVEPVHRLIVAVDIEGSTKRTNPAKGELRRTLYVLLERALEAAGITAKHRERHTDRGDGVLVLIRPHDDVPKTRVLGRLIPMLTALLIEHNAAVLRPELQLRLRAVVHAGEIHGDDRGFYGDDLDAAFRLLDAPKVKRALKVAVASPLVLVISEEIFNSIVRHGYLDGEPYLPLGRIQAGNRSRLAWIHTPATLPPARPGSRRARTQAPPVPLAIAPAGPDDQDPDEQDPDDQDQPGSRLIASGQRARSASTRAGMTLCRSPMMA
jgi:hypothetical protein